MNEPVVSVVMPVHNARDFVDESIRSILGQTLQDFHFIILDDASTDGSNEIIEKWAKRDSRIEFYKSERCLGLTGSSNLIVAKARAPIVARMDADDISHPDRLKRQVELMQRNPDIGAVGTLCIGIDAFGREIRPRDRWRVVRRSRYVPFSHGSATFRKDLFDAIGGYRECNGAGEDQDLFTRMAQVSTVVTLPDVLYSYRYHTSNATFNNSITSIKQNGNGNGNNLASYYMLGAMSLWAGQKPQVLKHMLNEPSLKWTPNTLVTLASAAWGSFHPGSLRSFLRLLIRTRDMVAGFSVEEGRPYKWRLK
ncbi:MAG TPA: glycosyltransferase family A protein [Pyrinomonadaceae bacterium]|nr:glycosyltransferase family A protein [Pyrinomonadaceae bacterium]